MADNDPKPVPGEAAPTRRLDLGAGPPPRRCDDPTCLIHAPRQITAAPPVLPLWGGVFTTAMPTAAGLCEARLREVRHVLGDLSEEERAALAQELTKIAEELCPPSRPPTTAWPTDKLLRGTSLQLQLAGSQPDRPAAERQALHAVAEQAERLAETLECSGGAAPTEKGTPP